jgi:hypothetical protein
MANKYPDGTFGGRGKYPKIKSGPRYGEGRSRSQDGSIRKKRSDAGIKRK